MYPAAEWSWGWLAAFEAAGLADAAATRRTGVPD